MNNQSKYISVIHKIRIFVLLSILSGVSMIVSASQQDSLPSYLQIAAQKNPTVLQKYYEYQAALQKIPQAGGLADPELNMGVFLSPMELLGGNQVAEIQLMQMFPWFGVLRNAKDEMSLMANAKFESFRDAKLQVFFEMQRTWYDLQRIRQNIRISEKNLDILRTLERITLVRYKTSPIGSTTPSTGGSMSGNISTPGTTSSSGMGGMNGNVDNDQTPASPPMQSPTMSQTASSGLSDLYRIQIETGNLENNIALLNSQYNTVAAKFNAYLNRPLKTVISIPDSIKKETLEIPILAISDSIAKGNPMVAMLQFEKQSLEARQRMVTKMGYPMVGIGINYSLINKNDMSASEMNGSDMIMPMVKVTLPIYRKKYKAMQQEAELLKTATEQNITATANSLQTEYFEVFQAYEDAERRAKLYQTQSQLANRSLDIMVRSFSASSSGASLSDILSIRQQTLDYEMKQIEALVDYNSAIAWLKRLTGGQSEAVQKPNDSNLH